VSDTITITFDRTLASAKTVALLRDVAAEQFTEERNRLSDLGAVIEQALREDAKPLDASEPIAELQVEGETLLRTSRGASLLIYSSAFEPGTHLEVKTNADGILVEFWSEKLESYVPVRSWTFGEIADQADVAATGQLEAVDAVVDELLNSSESESKAVGTFIKTTLEAVPEPERIATLRGIVANIYETVEAIDTRVGLGIIAEHDGDE
jgi:hypothetical protein